MWRLPNERPTSWPTMIPPRAGEITASQSNLRSLSASCPHTCAAMSVCCKRIAHWKYWRLCRPERKTKWPSSSAPVLRKSARRSSLIISLSVAALSECRTLYFGGRRPPLQSTSTRSVIRRLLGLPGICNSIDLYLRSLGQCGDLDSGAGRGILFEIRAINFVYGLEVSQISEEHGCLDHIIGSEFLGS